MAGPCRTLLSCNQGDNEGRRVPNARNRELKGGSAWHRQRLKEGEEVLESSYLSHDVLDELVPLGLVGTGFLGVLVALLLDLSQMSAWHPLDLGVVVQVVSGLKQTNISASRD